MNALKLTDLHYAHARDEFERYAALDGEVLPPACPPLRAAQIRLCRWQNLNFGFTSDERTSLGIAEELGELVEDIFGDLDKPTAVYVDGAQDQPVPDLAKVRDSVADAMVYTTQLLTGNRLDMVALHGALVLPPAYAFDGSLLGAVAAAARLCRAALKSAQKIRGFDNRDKQRRVVADNAARVFAFLRCFAGAYPGFGDVDAAYLDTVDKVVLKRNWKVDKAAGGAR